MIDPACIDEKVVAMHVWHLQLPVNSRRDHGIGTVADTIEVVVVELTSESGVTGYGEASPWSVFTGTPEANFAGLDRYLRPHVVGSRIGDWRETAAICQRAVVHCFEAKAAVETAFLDLAGRLLDVPAWALLGERVRESIPLSVSIANPDFDEDKALLDRIYDDGIRLIKLKTGFKSQEFDLMRIDYVRENLPGDLRIRIDYNQGLTVDEALPRVTEVDATGPDFIEQPVAAHEFDTMARLRQHTNAPLLADESVFGPEDLERAIREQICDGVSVKIMKSAGLIRGMQVARRAAEAGLPAYGGDMFETGIAHLAGVHMIAVSPNISLGCEFYHARYYLDIDLLSEPFPIEAGAVQVPDGPGLGFGVDKGRLEQFAVRTSTGQQARATTRLTGGN